MSKPQNNREIYLSQIAQILHTSIVRFMQDIRSSLYRLIITGDRAIYMLLKNNYRPKNIHLYEWKLWVQSKSNEFSNRDAAEYVGPQLQQMIKEAIEQQNVRIQTVDTCSNKHIKQILQYESIVPHNYTNNKEEVIGVIKLSVLEYGEIPIITLVSIPSPENQEIIGIDGVHFLIPNYINAMKTVTFKELVNNDALNCNYYKKLLRRLPTIGIPLLIQSYGTEYHLLRRNILNAVNKTIMGPLDLSVFPAEAASRPQFNISQDDIGSHVAYGETLSPEASDAILTYSGGSSSRMNLDVMGHFLMKDPITLPDDILQLQNVLINAPPFKHQAIVFKTARFMMIECQALDFLQVGDVQPQYVFNSTTVDNYFDFGRFFDEFSPCCAFRIVIPAGSKGPLFLGFKSISPQESEILLPYGCSFHIIGRSIGEVTYNGQRKKKQIFYNDMIVYDAIYIPPNNF